MTVVSERAGTARAVLDVEAVRRLMASHCFDVAVVYRRMLRYNPDRSNLPSYATLCALLRGDPRYLPHARYADLLAPVFHVSPQALLRSAHHADRPHHDRGTVPGATAEEVSP